MSQREQLQNLARWNRELVRENSRLHEALAEAEQASRELVTTNANLCAERSAADVFLGAAMDRLLEERPL
ncbi:MAG: hypothetical protein ACYDHN_16495 [Solirubrobacteraceae bacterium]